MLHTIRWTPQKIAHRLSLITPLVYRRREPLPPFRYLALTSPLELPPFGRDVDTAEWQVVAPPTYWGTWRTDFVLQTEFVVPSWEATSPVVLYLALGESGDFDHPEALVYIDGIPFTGYDRRHQEIRLLDAWRDGGRHILTLHGWTGIGRTHGEQLFMSRCEIAQIDQATCDFVATARVALGVADQLDEKNPAGSHLLTALDEAFRLLDTSEPLLGSEAFYASVERAHAALRTGISAAGSPLDVEIVATGQAHIDVAWLWPLSQARRKAERTFHTVVRLMEQFPNYHFTQGQLQLYDFIRQDNPPLFETIKQRVVEGCWEPLSDMWVEADCNLSGGESLARQLLLGRHFYSEHFGCEATSPVLWSPDVFGYPWSLPQLIKEAGLEYFFATKLGWNEYNSFPFDSFWWQGLDGSRVLTHFSPAAVYGKRPTFNSHATPEHVHGMWQNYKQKDLNKDGMRPPILMAFGYRGGGGPNREILENLREMADFPSTPRIRQGSVGEFFDKLARFGNQLPIWNTELYLEYHRGTYTITTRSSSGHSQRGSPFGRTARIATPFLGFLFG